MAPKKLTSVKVSAKAQAVISLHATRHCYSSVGGFLLGSSSENITNAIPVAHGPLTQVTIDTALSLLDDETVNTIVGWYTAPRLLRDSKPDAVALRVVAQMASDALEPVLLLVRNEQLCEFMNDGKTNFLQALGRDFGNQWLDEIKISNQAVGNMGKAELPMVNDLLDHFDDIQSAWFPNKTIDDFLVSL